MSFITPKEYKEISESLGEAFAQIRDSINDSINSSDAYAKVQETLAIVADSVDNDSRVSSSIDPVGSIMSDLGQIWQRTANNDFVESRATSISANLFGGMVRRLNDHVKNRTLDPSTGVRHRTIQEWFGTYAFTGTENYSLFWNDGSAPNSGDYDSYFSQNFEDLCAALNIAIPSEYKQSTYE
jgi:hypothetical protein